MTARLTIAKGWKSSSLSLVGTRIRVTQEMVYAKVEAVLHDRIKNYKICIIEFCKVKDIQSALEFRGSRGLRISNIKVVTLCGRLQR